MNSKLLLCWFALATSLAAADARAQAASAPSVPAAVEQRVPELGVAFVVPAGFTLQAGNGNFFLSDGVVGGAVFIARQLNGSLASLDAELVQPLQMGAVTMLPVGAPTVSADRRVQRFTGQGPEGNVTAFMHARAFGRDLIVMLAIAAADRVSKFEGALLVTDRSMRALTPRELDSTGSPLDTRLRGKSLIAYLGSGDYRRERRLHLCSNGTFSRNLDQASVSQNGSVIMADADSGTWRLEGRTLVLMIKDGSFARHQVTEQGAKAQVLLDGDRYFITDNRLCR